MLKIDLRLNLISVSKKKLHSFLGHFKKISKHINPKKTKLNNISFYYFFFQQFVGKKKKLVKISNQFLTLLKNINKNIPIFFFFYYKIKSASRPKYCQFIANRIFMIKKINCFIGIKKEKKIYFQ